jgi:ABC-type oligopeptide transport system substrate-binding subunit
MHMMKKRSNIWVLAAMLASATLAGCGGGETSASGPAATPTVPGGAGGTGAATLSWTAPTENSDGSAVTNLAGYRIYHGTSANALNTVVQVSNPGISLYVVDNLSAGTHYFAVSAYNSAGTESDRSAVASKTIM